MKTLIILLLWTGLAGAAQSIIIPQGVSEYGPVSVTTLHRFAGLYLESTSSAFTLATFKLFHSTDGGKTFPGDTGDVKTERPFCKFVRLGGDTDAMTFGADCPMPKGSTHVKARAIVEGGSVTIAKPPNINSKP